MDILDGLFIMVLILLGISTVMAHLRLSNLETTMRMVIQVQNELGVMISKGANK